jgi:hypothetical protein
MANGNAQEVTAEARAGALHNQLESLLEEAHIKLSSLVSDLLGASAWRMLKALAGVPSLPSPRPQDSRLPGHFINLRSRTRQ